MYLCSYESVLEMYCLFDMFIFKDHDTINKIFIYETSVNVL